MLLTEHTTAQPARPPRSLPDDAMVLRAPSNHAVPPQAELIMSAIDTGQYTRRERRSMPRARYRVHARLRLFSDPPEAPPRELFTRDVNPRGLGFITPHCLPLGYGGLLEIATPDAEIRTISCTLLRCREAAPGWFDGALYFNRQQADFAL